MTEALPHHAEPDQSPFQLLHLPDDILLCIADQLSPSAADLSSFRQVSPHLYQLLETYVYRQNIEHHGSWAFFWAAEHGYIRIIQVMLKLGVSPSIIPNEEAMLQYYKAERYTLRRTALSLAAENGHEDIVELLLSDPSTDPDACLPNSTEGRDAGRTPLSFAAACGHLNIVMILVHRNADINTFHERLGLTPLGYAARNGHTNVVEFLILQDGINLTNTRKYGETPLFSAAQHGHVDVVKVLLDHGCNPDSVCIPNFYDEYRFGNRLFTPLSIAVAAEHEDVVEALLATGKIDLHRFAGDYGEVLDVAARTDNISILRRLLAAYEDGPRQEARARAVAVAGRLARVDMVRLLVETPRHAQHAL